MRIFIASLVTHEKFLKKISYLFVDCGKCITFALLAIELVTLSSTSDDMEKLGLLLT